MSAAVILLAVFWPFESSGGGVVERALAAVGPGRVVHVRVRVHPQGTAVDLATGRRARVYAVIEQWYEPGVGLFQRVVQSNGGLEPGSLPLTRGVFPAYAAALQGFGSGYRDGSHRSSVARAASSLCLLLEHGPHVGDVVLLNGHREHRRALFRVRAAAAEGLQRRLRVPEPPPQASFENTRPSESYRSRR